jgi:prepilin-type N-terminal cleavage/methylation domain-containing protein
MPLLHYANARPQFSLLRSGEHGPRNRSRSWFSDAPSSPTSSLRSTRRALTLIELLLTIAILGIIAAAIIPSLSGDIPSRLSATAQIVGSDLEYARALAVSNNSKYKITFETGDGFYYLWHSGTNAILNTLPPSPFRNEFDTADTQTTDMTQLPLPPPSVELVAVVRAQAGGQLTTEIEFTPQGATTSVHQTDIWLACSRGNTRRFIAVSINPFTGLAQLGSVQAALPPAVQALVPGAMNGGDLKPGKRKKGT